MTTKRMKSNEVRVEWAEVLQHVRQGGTVIVEHYNKPIATITPYEEPTVTATYSLTHEQGTQTITVIPNDGEVREVTKADGDVVDDSIVYAGSEVDEYMRVRDMELTGEGYTKTA